MDFDIPITQSSIVIQPGDATDIETKHIPEAESSIRFIVQYSSNDCSNESSVETNNIRSIDISLADELRCWTVQNNVSHRSMNALLKILSLHGHTDLPIDI